jgi:uncharacterized small protein (DUF1192 family)
MFIHQLNQLWLIISSFWSAFSSHLLLKTHHPEPWQDSLRMEGQDIFLLSADHLKERLEALKDEVEQTVRHFQHKVRGA